MENILLGIEKILLKIAISMALNYLIIAFVLWDENPMCWSSEVRIYYVVMCFLTLLMSKLYNWASE